ncbi:MAG: EFR1 family ferrodoxin [Eubacteriales bacterium]|nr:EFR1 family ferrodoxin [Eubacteriales bacterium]
MIFYFSGTGNSRRVATQIAEAIGDETLSINEFLKKSGPRSFFSKQPLVFVTPTYAWRMPKIVERWIRQVEWSGNRIAYFVLTCGSDCGNAAAYAARLCQKKNFEFYGLSSVVMPENYLAMFPTPSPLEAETILEKAKAPVEALSGIIGKGERFPNACPTVMDRLKSGPVHWFFYPFCVHDRGFTVSDACVSCGKCVNQCPLNNIKLVGGRPQWMGSCTHCMACIADCPTEAIEYKNASKGRYRYHIDA